MSSILTSLNRTILVGFALTLLLIILFGSKSVESPGYAAFFFRYLHVISGTMWIGLLWYFNFVQIPSMSKIPDEQKPAISKVIAPTALFWFRFAAMATVLTGIILAILNGYAESTRARCSYSWQPSTVPVAAGPAAHPICSPCSSGRTSGT